MPSPASLLEIVERHAGQAGGLLPALHELQDTLGHIPPELVSEIARAFNISRAEVHGVISFYPDFRTAPAASHVLRLCRAEACQSMGSDVLARRAVQSLGCDFHTTSADGRFTLEPVYCLGLCAQAPALMLDGCLHARVSPEQLERLLNGAAAEPVASHSEGRS